MNGCAVRPLVPLAQVQREDAAVLDLDVLQDVRHQLEVLVVADQPGIAVDDHQPGVARPRDQHVQAAAGLADGLAGAVEVDDQRLIAAAPPMTGGAERPSAAARRAAARAALRGVVDGLNIGFCAHAHGMMAAEVGQMGGPVAQGERRRPRGWFR